MIQDAEKLRNFLIKRPWIHGRYLITDSDYKSLKARDGKFWGRLKKFEKAFLMGFVDGWNRAKS